MPDLDVSFVLDDPDFADDIVITRRALVVGADGVASPVTTATEVTTGVVTSGRPDYLRRLAEGERTEGGITVHARAALATSRGPSGAADIVTWSGASYVVVSVADYSRFGAGFVSAECDLLPFNP